MKNRAFTLIELLVVVLIIGILVAIAVPQYQKAVLKANLHKGVPLVESIYKAQQAHYLSQGDFADDIDDLDVSISKDGSCQKTQAANSFYECDFGKIGLFDGISNVQYQTPNKEIAYSHVLEEKAIERPTFSITFEKGKRYCFAKPTSKTAQDVCKNLGGTLIPTEGSSWFYYQLY